MTIIRIDGIPEGYELRKDYDGYKYILVYHEMDIIRKVSNWEEAPTTEECAIAIERWKKK